MIIFMSYENLKELTIKQYNRETTMEKHNAKLPVWMLTPNEEKEARKRWKEYAYKECDEVVKKFAECSKAAGLRVIFDCRGARDTMNACILEYQKPEELDRQRRVLIAEKKAKLDQESKSL